MSTAEFQNWVDQNNVLALIGLIVLSVLAFVFTRSVIARGLFNLVKATSNKQDDIIVKNLHPYRLAWLAPFAVLYALAGFFPAYENFIRVISLFAILWLVAVTLISLLNAVNQIYEGS